MSSYLRPSVGYRNRRSFLLFWFSNCKIRQMVGRCLSITVFYFSVLCAMLLPNMGCPLWPKLGGVLHVPEPAHNLETIGWKQNPYCTTPWHPLFSQHFKWSPIYYVPMIPMHAFRSPLQSDIRDVSQYSEGRVKKVMHKFNWLRFKAQQDDDHRNITRPRAQTSALSLPNKRLLHLPQHSSQHCGAGSVGLTTALCLVLDDKATMALIRGVAILHPNPDPIQHCDDNRIGRKWMKMVLLRLQEPNDDPRGMAIGDVCVTVHFCPCATPR